MQAPDIDFVHLGITIEHLPRSISVFGYPVMLYGIIITIGMFVGYLVVRSDALRRGQDPDVYLDCMLWAVAFSIIGARLYYVAFRWDYYRENPWMILNIREGGLAIYGGILAGALTLFIFTRIRKLSVRSMADTAVLGLITGQIIGRWGNFFNCEAFGGYTNNLFAMRIRLPLVNELMLNNDVLSHLVVENGAQYIQVHPTFLYESFWNLCVLAFLLWYRRRKRFDGEIALLYLVGYGLGRFWIEGLRTDALLIPGTGIAVSQALSLVFVVLATVLLIVGRKYQKRQAS